MRGVVLFLLFAFLCSCLQAATLTPYKEFDPYPFLANTTTCGGQTTTTSAQSTNVQSTIVALRKGCTQRGIGARLVFEKNDLFAYAEDYGHILHALPFAAFIPRTEADVIAFIAIANLLSYNPRTKFQIVVRGGSGNVQGATQGSCSGPVVIVDTTYLNKVTISASTKTAWVEPGTPFLSFVQAAAAQGLRPVVIPDYLGITVGGFVSVGGFGGDTPVYGPASDQVLALRIISPKGLLVQAGPGNKYYEAARGGMGVFGIVTSIKIKLVPTLPFTQSIHILIPNYNAYLQTMKNIITNYMPTRVDTIQSFAIPNNEPSYEAFIAPKPDLDLVRPNVDLVLALNVTYVYYIELAVRTLDYSDVPSKSEIGTWMTSPSDKELIFFTNYSTPDWDNRLKLFTVPFLVSIGAWYQPHPWTVVAFPDSSANLFDTYIQSLDPLLDTGMGLIALYPCPTSAFSKPSSLSVPTSSPFFYLATLGRTEVTGNSAILSRQERGNRYFWDSFKNAGQASIYASSYITDFGPSDWQHSFGSKWQQFLQNKKTLDPRNLFADQRNFGFSTIY